MKKKAIMFTIIFSLLLISLIFINSCVRAFSREEKFQINKVELEQKGEMTEQKANQIYKNLEEAMKNCDNICVPNENCLLYQQNDNCLKTNNECLQNRCDGIRNYHKQQSCHNNMCNR